METYQAIQTRQSVRKYQDETVPEGVLEKVLLAGTLAPSGKNKQPWKFYVVRGDKRAELAAEMKKGMDRLQKMGVSTGSAKFSVRVLEQAPVTVLVFNPTGKHPLLQRDTLETYSDIVDIQSVGAAVQNMLLAATDLGLGSLWICDVFFGYEEICEWVGEQGQMIAAVTLGYAAHSPRKRPRKSVSEVTVYLD